MAQDQHQETEETSVMLITWLTPHEAKTLVEMASARYTTTADMVRQAVKNSSGKTDTTDRAIPESNCTR